MTDAMYVTQDALMDAVSVVRVKDGKAAVIVDVTARQDSKLSSQELADLLRRVLNTNQTA